MDSDHGRPQIAFDRHVGPGIPAAWRDASGNRRHLQVFGVPGLDHAVRQKVVSVNGREYRLDLAYEEERVAVELDGERYHSSREQRERDRRRDAALATIDWLTLRYSHERLHRDVGGCRHDTLATLAARRGRRRRHRLTA